MNFPAEEMPSDQLLSRLYREVEKRCLSVHEIGKIKTLMHQVTTDKKKKRLADGLYVMEEEEETEALRTTEAYMDNLFLGFGGARRAHGTSRRRRPTRLSTTPSTRRAPTTCARPTWTSRAWAWKYAK